MSPPICVVTGAGGGLGEAITTELAREGAHVLAVARTAERAGALVRRIGSRTPQPGSTRRRWSGKTPWSHEAVRSAGYEP